MSAFAPLFVYNNFGARPVLSVFTDQKVMLVGGNSVTPVTVPLAELIAEDNLAVVPELNSLTVREGISHIDVGAPERIEPGHFFHIFNAEGVEFRNQLLLEPARKRKGFAAVLTFFPFTAYSGPAMFGGISACYPMD